MKMEQFYNDIMSALKSGKFMNTKDDIPDFLSYKSHFKDDDQVYIPRYICLENVNITFDTRRKEPEEKINIPEEFFFFKKLSDSDQKQCELREEIITFYFNNSPIFTVPLVLVYFSGTDWFYIPSHSTADLIKEIEKELSYFLTWNSNHCYLKRML